MSEYYAVVRSSDFLSHYGVKGMKWGVRKTNKRQMVNQKIAKNTGSYLNPPVNKHSRERSKVAKAFAKEYWRKIDEGMPRNEPSKQDKKLWNKYKTPYSAAVLKDLKLPNTFINRYKVKRVMKKTDPDYRYPKLH